MNDFHRPTVDLDRLADYLGDALDPAEAAEVRRLVDAEPAWARAYQELLAADAAVRDDLGVLIQPLAMPADIAARLDAVLALEPPPGSGGPAGTGTGTGTGADLGGTPVRAGGTAAAGASRPASGRPGTRRDGRGPRRPLGTRARVGLIAGAVAAIAAVIVLPAVAISNAFRTDSPTSSMASDTGEGKAGVAGDADAPRQPLAGAPSLLRTGSDYTPQSLNSITTFAGPSRDVARAEAQSGPGATDPELARLAEPAALGDCLHALQQAHGGSARTADYARFQGRPALVVLLSGPAGGAGGMVVVVGPGCGLGGATDQRYQVPAG